MSGKWLELLKEIAPQVERIGFMIHPETPALVRYFKSAEALASALKVKLVALNVHDAAEIERALIAFAAEGNGGLIVAMAARLRLPAIYPVAFYAQAGGLISYGLDPVNQFQQGAGYVDRILRGTRLLGLPVPPSLLARANEVIE